MDNLTIKDLAKMAGVTTTTVRNWIHRGLVAPVYVGGKVVAIRPESVDRVLLLAPLIDTLKRTADAVNSGLTTALEKNDAQATRVLALALLTVLPAVSDARACRWPDLDACCRTVSLAGKYERGLHVLVGEMATSAGKGEA